jgi:hypothetical protein
VTYDVCIETLAARRGEAVESTRVYAEREISKAVRDALAGQQSAFDLLPDELRGEARRRWRERVEAGERRPDVRSFTHTGVPL